MLKFATSNRAREELVARVLVRVAPELILPIEALGVAPRVVAVERLRLRLNGHLMMVRSWLHRRSLTGSGTERRRVRAWEHVRGAHSKFSKRADGCWVEVSEGTIAAIKPAHVVILQSREVGIPLMATESGRYL